MMTSDLKMVPKVSVIIPCFNREDTVVASVQSVLDQDYPSFEVIAVDDSSTDRTKEYLESIKDPRLRIVDNPLRRGPCTTRNVGIKESDGSWVAFQDSDDLWLPGKLRRQMGMVLEQPDAVAVYCGMVVKSSASTDARILKRIPGNEIMHQSGDVMPSLVFSNFISTQTVVIRRDVLEQSGGFDPDFQALVDWELMLRIAPKGLVLLLDEDLVEQRFSPNSITKVTERRVKAQEMVLNKHRDLIAEYEGAIGYHLGRIAGAMRRAGRHKEAQDLALQAWRETKSPKHLGTAAYSAMSRLFRH